MGRSPAAKALGAEGTRERAVAIRHKHPRAGRKGRALRRFDPDVRLTANCTRPCLRRREARPKAGLSRRPPLERSGRRARRSPTASGSRRAARPGCGACAADARARAPCSRVRLATGVSTDFTGTMFCPSAGSFNAAKWPSARGSCGKRPGPGRARSIRPKATGSVQYQEDGGRPWNRTRHESPRRSYSPLPHLAARRPLAA